MAGLQETLTRLAMITRHGSKISGHGRLQPFQGFGENPGQLLAKAHVPADLSAKSPLVVVLHGCTQTAEAYDQGAGWSELADELRFAVLYPKQQRANNPNLCFNWFQPDDIGRGQGEAASIRAMIHTLVSTYDLDTNRIFVTGLSAGGAMTAALLAAYPEIFAGGAIIGGLPTGAAASVAEALRQMRHPTKTAAGTVRAASKFKGPGPTVSIWHGDADPIVVPANAGELAEQWRDFHDARAEGVSEYVDGHRRTVWHDAHGRAVVERFVIDGMGHGVPLTTRGADRLGLPGAYMLDVGISSTRHIARFWNLDDGTRRTAPVDKPVSRTEQRPSAPAGSAIRKGPGDVIENALRAAGLMR